jgi:putative FmdB family regulatory protein
VPIYEYQCRKCGHKFELIQKFSDEPPKKCPQCGGKVERLISSPSVQFKGTGWYVTDYGRGSSGGDSKSSESSERSESKKEGSSESAKPAEKKEAKPAHKADKS